MNKLNVYLIYFGLIALLGIVCGCEPNDKNQQTSQRVLTYQELVNYPTRCENKEQQLAQLYELQRIKNFGEDPDDLSEEDEAYNGRLKATIWWYAYRCAES